MFDLISHTNNEMTITIGNSNANAYTISTLAFNNLNIFVFYCHISCLTCSGSLSNQCLSCYSNHELSSGSCGLVSNSYQTVVYLDPATIQP